MQLKTAFVLAGLLLSACVIKPGRSDVADGKLYEAGEPSYDEFFKSLYDVQLTMGHAPERAESVRQGLVKVADAPPAASGDELAAALDKRLDALSKHGVAVKLSSSELEGPDPTGKLVTSGTASDPADAKTVSDLEQTVKDAASLLTDLRHAKPELERLKEAVPPLSEKVDKAFADAPKRKRGAVKQNLDDAEKLIPLMESRREEVDGHVMDLLHAVEKASPPAIVTPPAELTDAALKKKKEKKQKGEAKGAAPKEPKAEAPKAPKPPKAEAPKEPKAETPKAEPPPKPKPKPADDFEP